MRLAAVPEGAPLPRSVAACLASILEVDDVPVPAGDHPEPWTVWRTWLAERGLGLVPVLEPQHFSWPGPWIALLGDAAGAIAYGSPPGLAWAPLGEGEFEAVTAGYVVAPLDAGLWTPTRGGAPAERDVGRVEALAVAAAAGAPMTLVERAVARAGRGLEGDRYFDGRGTFSNPHSLGHDLTLIDADAVEGLLAPADARRNVVTRGIDLNALVGHRFTVGEVECIGRRLCEPCARLQRLTEPGVLRALVHIGGLRADVLRGGTIRVGDELRTGALLTQ
ncbi:MAG TPA: MOSC domain-containing protein [Solirubrobacter sp.]|nr:MOSC domain-containing protein [Solirubrobacter sp.]